MSFSNVIHLESLTGEKHNSEMWMSQQLLDACLLKLQLTAVPLMTRQGIFLPLFHCISYQRHFQANQEEVSSSHVQLQQYGSMCPRIYPTHWFSLQINISVHFYITLKLGWLDEVMAQAIHIIWYEECLCLK